MDRVPVTSSMISSMGFDPEESLLEVEFNNGKVYQYSGVTPDTYATLSGADSIGKAFSSLIKSQGYSYRQV